MKSNFLFFLIFAPSVRSKFVTDLQGYFPNGRVTGVDAFLYKFPVAPHFSIVAESWIPHIYVQEDENGKLKCFGPMGKVLNLLAQSINFTYEARTGDGFWGAPQSNGSWNGMMGYVKRKEVMFAVGPIGVSDLRSQIVDFSLEIFKENVHIFMMRPQPESNLLAFIHPFHLSVWIGIILSIFAFSLLKYIFGKMDQDENLYRYFWETFSIFICQNLVIESKKHSSRLLTAVWMLIVLVFVRSYNGSLTSLLAVKNVPIKYDSLQDAINDQSLTYVMEGSTTLTAYLPIASEGIYKEFYLAGQGRTIYRTASGLTDFAKEELLQGHYVVLLEGMTCNAIYSDDYSKTGKCNFYKSRGFFWPQMFSIGLQKGSPLKELFDSRILAMHAAGLYDRWVEEQMPNMTSCIRMPTKLVVQQPYRMKDLWVVFALLAAGLSLSSLLFFIEILVHKYSLELK